MSSENPNPNTPPDMPESRQAAIKNRIITHLNEDHAFSLEIYLRHFCGVPQKQASAARLTDMTNDHMIIESRAGRNLILLKPPMKSLMEARERTIMMHNEALAGLGLSSTKIDTFTPPNKVWQVATCAAVVLCLVTFPFRSKLLPASGSVISQVWSVGGLVPALATLAYELSPFVLPFIIVVHLIEAENFARTRLRKHHVSIGSPLWWRWTVYAFLGGVACFIRFDELVRYKEEEKKKNEKH